MKAATTKASNRVSVSPSALAHWLVKQGKDRWWTFDGDSVIARAIQLPSQAKNLGPVLTKQGGEIFVVLPTGTKKGAPDGEILDQAIQDDGGFKLLELVWKRPDKETSSLLIEVSQMFEVA